MISLSLLTRCCINKYVRKYETSIPVFYGLDIEELEAVVTWYSFILDWNQGWMFLQLKKDYSSSLSATFCQDDQDTWQVNKWHNTEVHIMQCHF